MTKSNTTSLGHTRIGDYRLVVPYQLQGLSLWVMLRLWPDAADQRVLKQFQRAVLASPPQPERKPVEPLPAGLALARALDYLTLRHLYSLQYGCRWLFAEAVQRQAKAYKIDRPFDFYGAYAGLVSRPLDRTEDLVFLYGVGPHPAELMILLGATEVDTRIMAGDDPDELAKQVCRELIDAFSCGEYTAEDMAVIDGYSIVDRVAEERFIARVGG